MLFIVAERFVSSLEVNQYMTRFIEECQEDPLQSVVNPYTWNYLIQAFGEDSEAIQCLVFEQLWLLSVTSELKDASVNS